MSVERSQTRPCSVKPRPAFLMTLHVGCFLFIMTVTASAATVVAIGGDGGSSGGGSSLALQYGVPAYTSILAVGWTSSLSFTDVMISAQVGSNNPVGATGTAFLTTRIGDGTTISDQVAATQFVFPAFTGTWTPANELTLFTGLNLTAATSYFLTIVPNVGFTGAWNFSQNPTTFSDDASLTTQPASGYYLFVQDHPSSPDPAVYIPASSFLVPVGDHRGQFFSVTGNAVPEPSLIGLLGFGGGYFLCFRRARRR